MSEISLRAYLNRLDMLLNSGAADEVIHHCRHILRVYPKNVAAYRALGRALLLNGRWEEAGAAFRRVLSVIPDDYQANLGLSEVYDHLRKADEAIWHAERAYEQEPNRQDVLDAVRSLYRRYRNIENARVQLTSSALARQSLRNRQYDQALETLRNALNRMPDRLDLKILLARTLWEMGDQVQAAETAMDVHEKLPDCIDANRILTRLWLDVQRPSDAQKYLNRIEAVDPYLALELVTGAPASDDAFKIEELDYRISAQSELVASRPEWLQDLGETVASDAAAERWLEQAQLQGTHMLTPQTGLLEHSAASEDEDWMSALDKPLASSAKSSRDADEELPAEFAFAGGTSAGTENSGASSLDFEFDFEELARAPMESTAENESLSAFERDPEAWLRDAGIGLEPVEMPAGTQAGSEDLAELFGDFGDPGPGSAGDPQAWLSDSAWEYRPDDIQPPTAADSQVDRFESLFDLPARPADEPAPPVEVEDEDAWLADLEARAQAAAPRAAADQDSLSWLNDDDQFLEEALGVEALTSPDVSGPARNVETASASLFEEPSFDDLIQDPGEQSPLDLIENLPIERERYKTGSLQTLNLDDSPDPLDQLAQSTGEFAPMIADTAPGVTMSDLDDLFAGFDEGSPSAAASASADAPPEREANFATGDLPEIEVGWEDIGAAPASGGDVPGPRRGLTAMLKDANLDWMAGDQPAEGQDAARLTGQGSADDLSDWLAQFDSAPASAAGQTAEADDDLEWLSSLNADALPASPSDNREDAALDDLSALQSDADLAWLSTGETVSEMFAMNDQESLSAFDADQPESQSAHFAEERGSDDSGEAVPDWLHELEAEQAFTGESPSDGEAEMNASDVGEIQPLESGSLPDWLMEAAPLGEIHGEDEPDRSGEFSDDLAFVSAGDQQDLDSLFGVQAVGSEESASGGDLDWLDQLDVPSPPEAEAGGDEESELVTQDDSFDWLNELPPVEPEPEIPEEEPAPTIDFDALFVNAAPAGEPSDEVPPEPVSEEMDVQPAVDREHEALFWDEQPAAEAPDAFSEPSTLIFPPGDVAAAAAGLAASAAASTEEAPAGEAEFSIEGQAEAEAQFQPAAEIFDTGLLDFVPGGEVTASSSAAQPDDRAEAAFELDITPADNAPDWLNAMVPGLDVDYGATEDEPIETAFIDDADSEIGFDETAPVGFEVTAREGSAVSPAPGYDWLVDIVEEESHQLVPVETPALTQAAPRRRFVFTRRPLWYKWGNTAAGASSAEVDVPEWLR
jgi:tetratricopeptide (TPR) repeat protein